MAPRITIHNTADDKSWPKSMSASKSQERLEGPLDSRQGDIDYMSDGTDELNAFSRTNGSSSQPVPDDPSALQPQWETISTTTTSSKTAAKRPRQKPPTTRMPGQSLIPVSRVESIVQADADNGSPSKEAVFILALATEEFIHRFTLASQTRAKMDNRALTTYNDFADTVHYFEEFNFLKDMVPRPLTPKAALAERKRILAHRDALLNGQVPEDEHKSVVSTPMAAPAMVSSALAPKGQSRPKMAVNGKAAANPKGVTAPAVRSERQRNKKARLSYDALGEMSVSSGVPSSGPSEPNNKASASSTPSSGKSAGVKIKIRPRMMAIERQTSSQVLTLSPSVADVKTPQTNGVRDKGYVSSNALDYLKLETEHDHSRGHPGQDKFQMRASGTEGKSSNVLFAPVGVDVADPPLWTRVPLPPPPSPKARRVQENGGASDPDLPQQVSQPQGHLQHPSSDQVPRSRCRSTHSREHQMPPSSGQEDATPVDFREALSATVPNPGRTIYSQR